MEADKNQIKVLYVKNNNYYEILLNPLELNKITEEIIQIFTAKKMDVMVSDKKLKLVEEVETIGKKNSREIR